MAKILHLNKFLTTGNLTNGSPIITNIPSTTNIDVGDVISGTGLPNNAKVLTKNSSTQVTLNTNATASGTGVSLAVLIGDINVESATTLVADGNDGETIVEYDKNTGYWSIDNDIITLNSHSLLDATTGASEFGGISAGANPSTQFNVGLIRGWIVDNTTDPENPTHIHIECNGGTNLTTPYLLTGGTTYVLVDSSCQLVLQDIKPSSAQRRSNILLGRVAHPNGVIINITNFADFIQSPAQQVRDLWNPIKLINDGIAPYPNGANLSLNITQGTLWGNGINFHNDRNSPNELLIGPITQASFNYRTQTGQGPSAQTVIQPNYYDNNGTVTLITPPAKRATNQRIYITQNGQLVIQYGQTIYADGLSEALAGSNSEEFITFGNLEDNAILIGILSIESGATSLLDTTKARILLVGKFGESVGAAGGLATTTLQNAYDNSPVPQIVTNSITDGVVFRRGSTLDTDAVLRIQNGAGTETGRITGAGVITGSRLVSNITTGTSPLTISSTTLVDSLNADLLDGQHGSYYTNAGNLSGTIPSVVLGNSSLFIGTTSVTLNRASGAQTLTGVSIDGNAGTVTNGVYTNGSYADPSWITSLVKSKVGLSNVENTALSTWTGTSNITTLGTIGSGTWQGGIISPTYGGTGVNNASRTLTINTNSGTLSYTLASTTLTIANNASISGTNTGDQTTITGNAGSATLVATTQKSDNVNYQIPFVPSVTVGNQALHTDSISSITYNPSTNTLVTPNLTVSGNLTVNNVEMISTSNGVVFEGSTNDGIKTTLTATDPTVNRSITLPNNSGMVALTSDLHTRSHTMTSTSDHTAGNWRVFHSNGSGQVIELALGTASTYLKANGVTTAPTFSQIAYSELSGTPTIGDGTLSWTTSTAGITNTTIAASLSGAYSANTSTNRTMSLAIGPALTNLASTMTGVGTGFLRKNGVDTYSLDTNTYLTGNQTITLSGHITGSGTTGITTTIPSSTITNLMLVNSTISGIALGSNLPALTIGSGLSGTSYNGSTAVTIAHSNSITAGNVGPTANATLTFGGTFAVPQAHYDAQGHLVTNTTNRTMTMPSLPATMPPSAHPITQHSASAWRMFFSNATTTSIQELPFGVVGTYLRSGGAAINPTWQQIAYSEISGTPTIPAVNDGTLTLNTSGVGLSGSSSFSANQSGSSTFTVTSNATNTNTASTIVARDASGNFNAGTITATLNGGINRTINAGTDFDIIYGLMAANDYYRIRAGGATNAGYIEIATADDGTEPIHFRQYTGAFTTLTRTATILDGSGNTSLPGSLTVGGGLTLTGASSVSTSTGNLTLSSLGGNGRIDITPNGSGTVRLTTLATAGFVKTNATGDLSVDTTSYYHSGNLPPADPNWYPTAFAWTNGTTAGPTGSLTGVGMSAVSYTAIPTATGSISGIVTTGAQTFAGNKTFSNDVVISGSLTINGSTTTLNTATLTVEDINIELGKVTTPTNTTANGGGITLLGTTNKTIIWDSTNTNWTSSEHWNILTGKEFKINNNLALNSTTLRLYGSSTGYTNLISANASATNYTATLPAATGTIALTSDLHNRSHTMTSTSDHTAGNWRVFHSNGSGQVIELALGAASTYLKANGVSAAPTFSQIAYSEISGTPTIPTVGDGTLSWAASTAGTTNTTIAASLSGAYSANTSTNRTMSLAIGPALTNLATTMTGAGTGFLRKNGADTYTLDTSTYLTGNQTITLTGNVTGSGTTSIATTIGTGVVTNTMLANSTISGIALGSNLAALTIGAGLSGTSYNGSTAVTITHSNSITASNVGPTANATLTFGGTFTVPQVHYDAQGHIITNTTNRTMTMPSLPATMPPSAHAITAHSATAWRMFFSNATTTTVQELAFGAAGTYLRSGGAAANPTWATIAYSELSGTPTIGNGTLTMNTSGSGISGSATFTANQTGASTFTVTSNATSNATASTIVLRDANADIRTNTELQATNFTMKYDSTSKSVKFIFV